MIWLPRTTDYSTYFAQCLEIRGIERRLYFYLGGGGGGGWGELWVGGWTLFVCFVAAFQPLQYGGYHKQQIQYRIRLVNQRRALKYLRGPDE